MKRTAALLPLAAVFALVLTSQAMASSISVVDTGDSDSPASSLSVSPSGRTFVTWQDSGGDDLWRAHWDGSAWVSTQLAGAGTFAVCFESTNDGYDYGPASGFSPTGGGERIATACISILGPAPIRWTRYSSNKGQWVTRTIAYAPFNENSYSGVTNLDLAFDPDNGYPSIAYGDVGEHTVSWLHWTGTEWVNSVVVDGGPGFGVDGSVVSIAFDPLDGEPAIAWNTSRYSGALVYGKYDGLLGQWDVNSVSEGIYGVPSLAFAPDGTPWIAYQSGTDVASVLAVSRLVNGSWSASKVDRSSAVTGFAPSLAFQGNLARIAYHDQTNGDLRWASFTGSVWLRSTLESTNDVGEYPSLAFNSSGARQISYYDRTNKDIRAIRAH